MEYAEKHYVNPQNQLNKLRAGSVRETIQQVVENDLDVAIRNILQRTDLDPHGKVKLYSNVLQKFLTIVKQGDLESGTLTLTLPKQDAVHTTHLLLHLLPHLLTRLSRRLITTMERTRSSARS